MKSLNRKKKTVKHIKRASKRTRDLKGGAVNGALYAIAILAIVFTFGGVMAGGAIPELVKLNTPPPPKDPYSCCDTGDGAQCRPIAEKTVIFNGDTYALLKSKIYQGEVQHIAPAELAGFPETFTPDGHKVFVNTSDTTAKYTIPGCESGKDLIGLQDPAKKWGGCFGVPNDQLIYICQDTTIECSKKVNWGKVPFDVYFRLKDGAIPPEVSVNCPKPKAKISGTGQQVIVLPTPSGTANLQLETFRVEQEKPTYEWMSAWCKPADYFYPTEKTDIHFDVKPQGPFTYTLPQYPAGGWKFTAYPDGNLVYKGKSYPYIYWEAAIPNELTAKPNTGYSVAYKELPNFLLELLPKMGLNEKEAGEFVDYWRKQLPDSKYYFVGVIPEEQINAMAPLSIAPAPESVLRVSLYFEPLQEKIAVTAPQLDSFEREGFTVVEWGALFDTKKHPGFSCLM